MFRAYAVEGLERNSFEGVRPCGGRLIVRSVRRLSALLTQYVPPMLLRHLVGEPGRARRMPAKLAKLPYCCRVNLLIMPRPL